jgi:hypothetical protein
VLTYKADAPGKWDQHNMQTSYHASVGSTYKKDYDHKVQSPFNYRDLDSFKDKIKYYFYNLEHSNLTITVKKISDVRPPICQGQSPNWRGNIICDQPPNQL